MPPKSNGGAAPGTSGALAGDDGGGAAAPLDFDMEDGVDGPDAINKVPNVAKIEYDADNVARWLNRLEIRMETHGINSQWAKRCCLETALPPHIQPDLNEKWDIRKSKAGKTIYYDCKQLLLKLHGPRPEDSVRKAIKFVRPSTMSPSVAAQQLVALVCEDQPPLENCC